MRSLIALILVVAHCAVAAASQPAGDARPRVRITTSDGLGVRVEDRATLAVDVDKVVVPSLYLWGAADITLSFGGEPRHVKRVYEASGASVSMIVFDPPIPPEAVPDLNTSMDLNDLGAWLSQGRDNPPAHESEQVRIVWFRRNAGGVSVVVTPDRDAVVGSEFYFSDGRVAGVLTDSLSFQPGYPEAMSLCPAFVLSEYVAWADRGEGPEGNALTPYVDRPGPVVDEMARLLLSAESDAGALDRVAATWTQRDSGWSTRLPQELYFDLLTAATKHQLQGLERQLLHHPPEFYDGGTERLRRYPKMQGRSLMRRYQSSADCRWMKAR